MNNILELLKKDAETARLARGVKNPSKAELIPEGFTDELRASAKLLGSAGTDGDLHSLKTETVQIRRGSQGELKEVRHELKIVSAPYRARIEELRFLIESCDKQLGIKKIKRASKVEILSVEREQLLAEIAKLKAENELAKLLVEEAAQ